MASGGTYNGYLASLEKARVRDAVKVPPPTLSMPVTVSGKKYGPYLPETDWDEVGDALQRYGERQ